MTDTKYPWAAALRTQREALQSLRLDCEDMRSSFLFHHDPEHLWRAPVSNIPYPGRQHGIQGMTGSDTRGVAALVWADAPKRQMVEARGGSTENEQRALGIFAQLGETIPPDDLQLMLAGPLEGVDRRRGWVRWLAVLHSVAWRRTVPGIKANRMTWPEGCIWVACTIPDDIEPGEHKPRMLDWALLSEDWVSELTTPPVLASMLLIDHTLAGKAEGKPEAGGADDDLPALTPGHYECLRVMQTHPFDAWQVSKVAPERDDATNRGSTGRCLDDLARHGWARRISKKKGYALTPEGRDYKIPPDRLPPTR